MLFISLSLQLFVVGGGSSFPVDGFVAVQEKHGDGVLFIKEEREFFLNVGKIGIVGAKDDPLQYMFFEDGLDKGRSREEGGGTWSNCIQTERLMRMHLGLFKIVAKQTRYVPPSSTTSIFNVKK
jgi:hypothetical protein